METALSQRGAADERAGPQIYTFLFSDIEGSTRLLQRLGGGFAAALATHHQILRDAVAAHAGVVRRTEGDSFFATFATPSAALHAAVDVQRRLAAQAWPEDVSLQVRVGLHTGEAQVIAGEFVGLDVHRAARIMSVGWGGQILVSGATHGLLQDEVDVRLRDLGEHRLKDLKQPERLYQAVAEGLRVSFPALRTIDAVPNNLPAVVTSFVGRDREIAEVTTLLEQARIVTLTGAGGTGKTRLSLQVAEQSAARYPDGVFFVPLASVTDPDLVMSTVAATLGLTSQGGRTSLDLVTTHLEGAHALLVLDNFEQVLPAGVELSKLVASAPGVSLLVSSRARLRISGEHEYPVPPLPLPSSDTDVDGVVGNDAAVLFAARAAGADPQFHIHAGNASAVAQIVRRLEGLPLAIELAAARVKLLPVEAIAKRLDDSLTLLSGGARDLPDRQRTLRGAIAWSYDLLDAPARRLFARCSVFRGGADYERLEQVCGVGLDDDVLDVLSELVDHSLLRRRDDADGVRFGMLETIREFAAERLNDGSDADEVRRRHAAAYLALAEQAAPFLVGDDGAVWNDRLEREHDNLRAALEHASHSGDTSTALRLVSALWRMWQVRGHLSEGHLQAQRVLALPGVEDHPRELAAAYEAAGGLVYWQGDLSGAREPYERALELYRKVGDTESVARSIYNLAFTHGIENPQRSSELFTAALEAFEELGDELWIAKARWGLMVRSLWSADYETMRAQGELCLPVFRSRGEPFDLAWALHMVGVAEHAFDNDAAAAALFGEALDMFEAQGDTSGLYLVLADFAYLFESAGDLERSVRLLGAVDRLADDTGSGLLRPQLAFYPRRRHAEDELDAATYQQLRAEGYQMTPDDAMAYARAPAP